MLTILILLQLDLPPLELKVDSEEDRKQYIKAMQNADDREYSLLEELIAQALTETLQLSQK